MRAAWSPEVALLAALLCTGCASPAGSSDAAPMSTAEIRRFCAGQMYADRVAHGRSAVNWSLYDRCLQSHKAAGP